jgi:hypothetical protein
VGSKLMESIYLSQWLRRGDGVRSLTRGATKSSPQQHYNAVERARPHLTPLGPSRLFPEAFTRGHAVVTE